MMASALSGHFDPAGRYESDTRICYGQSPVLRHPKGVTMTRDELYGLVWQTPMRTLAKRYGLSDVGLRKICKKHEIPTPPLGYWAKRGVRQEDRSAEIACNCTRGI